MNRRWGFSALLASALGMVVPEGMATRMRERGQGNRMSAGDRADLLAARERRAPLALARAQAKRDRKAAKRRAWLKAQVPTVRWERDS